MDSVTQNNVVKAKSWDLSQKLWALIKEILTLSQASNQVQIFNSFLYIKFQEDSAKVFVMDVKLKLAIKKLLDIDIDLLQDILVYLVLFKLPALMHILKKQIMHSEKELSVNFFCNH